MESALRLCRALTTLSREGYLSLYDKDLVNTYVDQAQNVFGYPRWYQICFLGECTYRSSHCEHSNKHEHPVDWFSKRSFEFEEILFSFFFLFGFQGDYHVNIKVNENASGRLLTCLDLQLSVTEHKEPSGWLFGRRKRRSQN